MTYAEIVDVRLDKKEFKSIVISEVGEYFLPTTILENQPLYSSAFDVVDITPAAISGYYRIVARGNIVGTELLSPSVRLDIRPKISIPALHALLRWSTHSIVAIRSQELPVSAEEGQSILDVFADRFVRSLIDIEGNGWMPEMEAATILANDIIGEIDLIPSLELIYGELDLRFAQHVERFSFNSIPNRILRTAAEFIVGSRYNLSDTVRNRADDLVAGMPHCGVFANGTEAEDLCQQILNSRTLDGSRAYYYPALEAAVPVLQMLARFQGGSKEIRDIAMRFSMEDVFESAVRNVVAQSVARTHSARKENMGMLYPFAAPRTFNARMEPDIVLRPLGRPEQCDLIIDAKYKERPSATDHYQLNAYVAGAGCQEGLFVTVAAQPVRDRPFAESRTVSGTQIFEFCLSDQNMHESLRYLVHWIGSRLNLSRRAPVERAS